MSELRLVADRSLRRLEPRCFAGGSPLRLFRTSAAGTAVFERLCAGESWVPEGSAQDALAERLVAADAAHRVVRFDMDPDEIAERLASLSVVIPVRDDAAGLAQVLEAVGSAEVKRVVVVDDGSVEPDAVATLAARHAADLVQHDTALGPAAARNAGLARVDTPIVVFVDADVTFRAVGSTARDLAMLTEHFDDDGVAAAAPRVVGAPGPGPLARHDALHGPLDMGDAPATVGAGRRVSYVPSAVLLADAESLRSVGGFDESLRFGEDVDLVWRLVDRGHQVRYEPAVKVYHRARADMAGWLRQRFSYGTSAAPLGQRHGGVVAPVVLTPWSAALWGALATGHLLSAAVVASMSVVRVAKRLQSPGSQDTGTPDSGTRDAATRDAVARGDQVVRPPVRAAVRLVFEGNVAAGRSIATALIRPWFPVTALLALVSPRFRKVALVAIGLRVASSRGSATERALTIADDAAYSLGVWAGVLRSRNLGAVLPRFSR